MTAAVKVPHVHAEAIKAWADGAQIEYRPDGQQHWTLCGHAFKPSWAECYEYRVKPEKVYPVTQMMMNDFNAALVGYKDCVDAMVAVAIANAALRHAIDASQIITMEVHKGAVIALGQNLRDVEITRHADRDRRIAEAVRGACYAFSAANGTIDTRRDIGTLDLATIITKVRP